jgi:hypothetical protein
LAVLVFVACLTDDPEVQERQAWFLNLLLSDPKAKIPWRLVRSEAEPDPMPHEKFRQ